MKHKTHPPYTFTRLYWSAKGASIWRVDHIASRDDSIHPPSFLAFCGKFWELSQIEGMHAWRTGEERKVSYDDTGYEKELYEILAIVEGGLEMREHDIDGVARYEPLLGFRHATYWSALIAVEVGTETQAYEASYGPNPVMFDQVLMNAIEKVSDRERSSKGFSLILEVEQNRFAPLLQALQDASDAGRLPANAHFTTDHLGGGIVATSVYFAKIREPEWGNPEHWHPQWIWITEDGADVLVGFYKGPEDEEGDIVKAYIAPNAQGENPWAHPEGPTQEVVNLVVFALTVHN